MEREEEKRGKKGEKKKREREKEEDRKIINANEKSSRSRRGRTRIGEINERMRSGLRLGERELIQEYALPSTCTSS